MKLKYYLFIVFIFMIGIVNVDASSIEYNLTIDEELKFYENIVYKVKKSELDTSGNYDFLTSVVNDKIYFDIDGEVLYTKAKKLVGDEYIITLKNDFYPLFFSSERIINECFSKFDFEDNKDKLSVSLESPFYCLHRADTIKVNIKTDLYVSDSNADVVNGKVYTWNVEDKEFDLRFSAQIPELESAPADEDYEEVDDGSAVDDNEQIDEANDDVIDEENDGSVGKVIGIIVLVIVLVGGIIAFIILKNKNNNLNKI